MIYVTSDLHGYPKEKILDKLNEIGFSDQDDLYVLGDVIDRNGDGGIEMLLWMMKQENVHLLLGNHEAMLLTCRFLFEEITDEGIEQLDEEQLSACAHWLRNGAEVTMNSLQKLQHKNPALLRDLLDYLSDLKLYDILKVNGKIYILDHAGLGNFSEERDLPDYEAYDLLWYRPELTDRFYGNVTTVFGHTPTYHLDANARGRMIQTETWIDIDTGAAGGGNPMILRLDDKTPFYFD